MFGPLRTRAFALATVPFVLALFSPAGANAQAVPSPVSNKLTIADYFDWEDVSNPALSPDGKQRFDVARRAKVETMDDAQAVGRSAGEELLSRAGRAFFQV